MKIVYNTLIEVVAEYEAAGLRDYDPKTPTEFTSDLSGSICDVIRMDGGVGSVTEVCTKRTITFANGEISTKVSFNN